MKNRFPLLCNVNVLAWVNLIALNVIAKCSLLHSISMFIQILMFMNLRAIAAMKFMVIDILYFYFFACCRSTSMKIVPIRCCKNLFTYLRTPSHYASRLATTFSSPLGDNERERTVHALLLNSLICITRIFFL